MLSKLLKHEFYATSYLLLPLFVIVLVVTPISAASLALSIGGFDIAMIQILNGFLTTLYVLTLIGFSFGSLFIVVYRFYKSMVSDEAYLTHTLPVKTSSVIVSKLIVAFVWQVLTFVVVIFSILLYTRIAGFWNLGDWNRFWSVVMEGLREMDMGAGLISLEVLVTGLVGIIFNILVFYCSIAIGQLMKGHRILGAIVAYIVINIVIQVVSSIFYGIWAVTIPVYGEVMSRVHIHTLILGTTAYIALFSTAFYFITQYVFSKKLNLE